VVKKLTFCPKKITKKKRLKKDLPYTVRNADVLARVSICLASSSGQSGEPSHSEKGDLKAWVAMDRFHKDGALAPRIYVSKEDADSLRKDGYVPEEGNWDSDTGGVWFRWEKLKWGEHFQDLVLMVDSVGPLEMRAVKIRGVFKTLNGKGKVVWVEHDREVWQAFLDRFNEAANAFPSH